jgi:hypothetical protein
VSVADDITTNTLTTDTIDINNLLTTQNTNMKYQNKKQI